MSFLLFEFHDKLLLTALFAAYRWESSGTQARGSHSESYRLLLNEHSHNPT